MVHALLLGEHGFYDEIFESLRIPYEPIRWVQDVDTSHDDDINKVARVQELIHAYRVRGHLMADTDPLEYKQRRHQDLDVTTPRADPVGPRPHLRHRRLRRPAVPQAAQDPRHPARLVLPHHRRRVHAHPGPRAARVDPVQDRGRLRQDHPRGAAAHRAPAQRRRGVRDLPADQVRRPEALLARGRRVGHRPARPHPVARRRGRPRRGLHRDAAPRPPQRARQHRGQVLRPDLPRVRGQAGPPLGAGLRRREVPPRHRGHLHRRERHDDQGLPRRQPLPPRGRQPGARGHRAGQAGPPQPRRRGLHRPARAHARRRGVRRPGRGRRDAQPLAAARLPHRRHRARRHQQPGRLHDLAEHARAPRRTPPTSPG